MTATIGAGWALTLPETRETRPTLIPAQRRYPRTVARQNVRVRHGRENRYVAAKYREERT
jgi:hypothetical protein